MSSSLLASTTDEGGESSKQIVVLGSLNMDLVLQCGTLPAAGETTLAKSSREVPGGKGGNAAVAAARASADARPSIAVRMLAAVGDDSRGRSLCQHLRNGRVDVSEVRTIDGATSGLAVVAVDDDGENLILVDSGANGRLDPGHVEQMRDAIAAADLLMLQCEIPLESVVRAIEIAKEVETTVLLDPAPAPSEVPDAFFDVDFLCPNQSEVHAMTGQRVKSVGDASAAAKKLVARGAKHVAVTLGAGGVWYADRDRAKHIAARKIDAVDTTAAGDALAGAAAAMFLQTGDWLTAMPYAVAAGTRAASVIGAGPSLGFPEQIRAFLPEV